MAQLSPATCDLLRVAQGRTVLSISRSSLLKKNRYELYFRVETESSVQLPLTLYTEAEFGVHTASENMGFGLFYGAIIVILLFNLLQWLMIKEAVYGQYVGFLASLLIFQMGINGSLFEWIFPDSPSIANVSLLIFNFLAWGFGLLFAASFLTLESISPKFDRTVKGLAVVCALGAAASLILPYRSLVAFVVIFAVAFPAVFFAMGIIGIRAGQRSAKYFTLAFAILMVGSVLYALKTATILLLILLPPMRFKLVRSWRWFC